MPLRDLGDCCLIVPLKLGVGGIAMITFGNSLVCALALISHDIRFQPNGYNPDFYYLPQVVGLLGIVLGFVGLLGVYDDKPNWVQAFGYFMYVNWIAMVVAVIGDYVVLRKCDDWLVDYPDSKNVAMNQIAKSGVCSFALKAYVVGSGVALAVWGYFTWKVRVYINTLAVNLPYEIDFGNANHSMEDTWLKYQVKDPRPDMDYAENLRKQRMADKAKEAEEKHTKEYYGSMESGHGRYGPDGMEQSFADVPMDIPAVVDEPVTIDPFEAHRMSAP